MFTKSAKFYDALYHFKDYSEAVNQLNQIVKEKNPEASALLDVACGTGKHIEYLRKFFHSEGLDLSDELLNVARERCPEVTFHKKDMTDFDLGKKFDVVTCLFSSVAYVKSVKNLERAVSCMARHLKPGGILVLEPWFSPEKYWVGRITANYVDQPELKIAWMYTSEIEGNISVFNINYLVGTPDGVDYFTEKHEMGLFTDNEYLEAFRKAGLKTDYDPKGLFGRGMYIATHL